MIKHFLTRQFLKFLLVGSTAASLNWLSRLILNLWLSFSHAVIIAYLIGMSVAFILNKIFVFPKSSKAYHKQARDFIITNLCFWPIVWAASIEIKILLEYLGVITVYAENIAHLAALSLPICASFLIYKFYAFK